MPSCVSGDLSPARGVGHAHAWVADRAEAARAARRSAVNRDRAPTLCYGRGIELQRGRRSRGRVREQELHAHVEEEQKVDDAVEEEERVEERPRAGEERDLKRRHLGARAEVAVSVCGGENAVFQRRS